MDAGVEAIVDRIPADWDPNVLELAQLRHNVCAGYKVEANIQQTISRALLLTRARPFARVLQDAEGGSAEDCLDLGQRLFVGYGAPKDQDTALEYWRRIVDPTHPRYLSAGVSRSSRARAHCCISRYWFDRRIVGRDEWNIVSLYRAALNADLAASLGLIFPNVLFVAKIIESSGFRRPEDNRFPQHSTKRFERLETLWAVADQRKRELEEENRRRDRKVAKAPLAYMCAAQGCGIEGTKKAALLQCAGKCPRDQKPSYCSKECQKQDWKRHKLICKPSSTAGSSETPQQDTSLTAKPELPDEFSAAHFNPAGMECRLDMPMPDGSTVNFASKTMSPAFMKEMREHAIEKLSDR
ncbi:hypothetical protein JAAARDRAFT_193688 [Jaapia argillacea MUCL 33604]|uniref:MYND-type domain-containing protein n=1 Tax=Jaapia argillacea MUCL 33604 TaxID=933084 RepID=A0A067Q6P2_9AGAM|nr:hypothetical protein JAAARDRAFT_193688 [Jaapia argillacea MUCL 33604]